MFNKKKAKNKYSSNNQIHEKIGTVFKRSAECVRLTVKRGLEGIKTSKQKKNYPNKFDFNNNDFIIILVNYTKKHNNCSVFIQ